MIIPAGINTFYMILIKSYFSTIPENLEESARIDGANDIYILFKIVIPISAPILATITLFYAVDRWNDWFNAMLFIKSPDKLPLQIILRNMLVSLEMSSLSQAAAAIQESKRPIYAESLRAAIIIITSDAHSHVLPVSSEVLYERHHARIYQVIIFGTIIPLAVYCQ